MGKCWWLFWPYQLLGTYLSTVGTLNLTQVPSLLLPQIMYCLEISYLWTVSFIICIIEIKRVNWNIPVFPRASKNYGIFVSPGSHERSAGEGIRICRTRSEAAQRGSQPRGGGRLRRLGPVGRGDGDGQQNQHRHPHGAEVHPLLWCGPGHQSEAALHHSCQGEEWFLGAEFLWILRFLTLLLIPLDSWSFCV